MLNPKDLISLKDPNKPRISQFLTEMRLRRGMTKTALAETIQKTQPYITQLESGLRTPNMRLIKDICNRLECTAEERSQAIEYTIEARNPELAKRLYAMEKNLAERDGEIKRLSAQLHAREGVAARDKSEAYGVSKDGPGSVELWDDSLLPIAGKGSVALIDSARKPHVGDLVIVKGKGSKLLAGRYYLIDKKPALIGVNPLTVVDPLWLDKAADVTAITGFVYSKG